MSERHHSVEGYAIMTLGALVLGKMALDIIRELIQEFLVAGAIVAAVGIVTFKKPILSYLQERGYLNSGSSTPALLDKEEDDPDDSEDHERD